MMGSRKTMGVAPPLWIRLALGTALSLTAGSCVNESSTGAQDAGPSASEPTDNRQVTPDSAVAKSELPSSPPTPPSKAADTGGAAGGPIAPDRARGGNGGSGGGRASAGAEDGGGIEIDAALDPLVDAGPMLGFAGAASNDAGQQAPALPLPDGARQVDGIVNLVTAAGVAQVNAMLQGDTSAELTATSQLLLEHYLDEYDFLFVLVDHEVPNAVATAAFSPVHRPAYAPRGHYRPVELRQEYGSERLKGVIGGTASGGSPPLEHELLHYWAAHLDAAFEFGIDAETDWGSHWGLTSVHGQLGGFNEDSLECANPAGAIPPDCLPEANGRTVYSVASFAPYVNRAVDYAPLELYLMGLLPAQELPTRHLRLDGGAYVDASFEAGRLAIEADGIVEILTSDVLTHHGEIELLSPAETDFTAAFIVVSEAPASDEVMSKVSEWAQIFGNEKQPGATLLRSVEERTGGRATLSTRLGRRRTAADPLPMPPVRQLCDLILQDCGDGLACYSSARQCSVPGVEEEGAACTFNSDCIPGYGCPNRYDACAQYCDPFDDTTALSCSTLCPLTRVGLANSAGQRVSAYCPPEGVSPVQ